MTRRRPSSAKREGDAQSWVFNFFDTQREVGKRLILALARVHDGRPDIGIPVCRQEIGAQFREKGVKIHAVEAVDVRHIPVANEFVRYIHARSLT